MRTLQGAGGVGGFQGLRGGFQGLKGGFEGLRGGLQGLRGSRDTDYFRPGGFECRIEEFRVQCLGLRGYSLWFRVSG